MYCSLNSFASTLGNLLKQLKFEFHFLSYKNSKIPNICNFIFELSLGRKASQQKSFFFLGFFLPTLNSKRSWRTTRLETFTPSMSSLVRTSLRIESSRRSLEVDRFWISAFIASRLTHTWLDFRFEYRGIWIPDSTVGIWLSDRSGNRMVTTCPVTEWFINWMVTWITDKKSGNWMV